MAGPTAGDRGPEAVGRALRECREAFGRSLEDVAETTRIRLAYLEALEAGDYDAFPGEFWARLFLRSYAQQLGLPPDETIARAFGEGEAPPPPRGDRERFDLDDRADGPGPAAAAAYRPRARGRGRASSPIARQGTGSGGRRSLGRLSALGPRAARRQWASPVVAVLAALVVAALLAGIVYNFLRSGAPASHQTAGTAGSATSGRSPASGAGSHGAGQKSGHGAGAAKPGGGKAASTPPASAVSAGYTTVAMNAHTAQATYRVARGPIELRLTFRGRCWIGIQNAGSSAYVLDNTYAAGQSLNYASARAIVVEVGATPLARGTLNGQVFGPWPTGRAWYLTLEP